jgi:hypothetical protein
MDLSKGLKTVLACALLWLVPSLIGQNDDACLRRTVIASVVDEGGFLPRDLGKGNFRGTYHGKTINVLSVAYTEGSRRVVILLDVSGSMRGRETDKSDKWQIARAAASELVASLPPGSKASLITFTNKIHTEAALSTDFKPIQDWLNHDTARHPELLRGPTALYSAILAAVKALEPAERGDAIYVITDARENASQTRVSEVERALRTSGVRLFAFVLSAGSFINVEEPHPAADLPGEREGWAELLGMSRNSGGLMTALGEKAVFPGVSPHSWRYIYDDLTKGQIRFYAHQFSQQITGFYSLTFQIPEDPTHPQHWELTVVDAGGHKRKDASVAYPRELSPCGKDPTRR